LLPDKPEQKDRLQNKKKANKCPKEETGSVKRRLSFELVLLWHNRRLSLRKYLVFAKFAQIACNVFCLWNPVIRKIILN